MLPVYSTRHKTSVSHWLGRVHVQISRTGGERAGRQSSKGIEEKNGRAGVGVVWVPERNWNATTAFHAPSVFFLKSSRSPDAPLVPLAWVCFVCKRLVLPNVIHQFVHLTTSRLWEHAQGTPFCRFLHSSGSWERSRGTPICGILRISGSSEHSQVARRPIYWTFGG